MKVTLKGRARTTPSPKAHHMIINTKNAGMGRIPPWHQDGWPLTGDMKERFPVSYSVLAMYVNMPCLKIGLKMRALGQGFLISLYQVLEISSDMILNHLIHEVILALMQHPSQTDTPMRVHRLVSCFNFIPLTVVCIGFWYHCSNDWYCICLMSPVYTAVASCSPYALYLCSSCPICRSVDVLHVLYVNL